MKTAFMLAVPVVLLLVVFASGRVTVGPSAGAAPGTVEENCANDIRLQRAQARVYRRDLSSGQRGVVFARGSGGRTFRCFTDESGAVVHVTERR